MTPVKISRERHPAKRLALFSHKGGVGKTTLTVNLAFALAARNKRVLLVDSDPQCNLSAYLLDSDALDQLLDSSDSEDGKTLWTVLRQILKRDQVDESLVTPMDRPWGISLIPGDIKLSELEEELALYWQAAKRRDINAFSAITSISLAVNSLSAALNADFVFYDCGPNVGPLNRCILLDCDYFIVPTACDEFSIRALSTLGASLSQWLSEWSDIADLAPDGTYLPPGKPQFLGYILQQFRVYGGQIASGPAQFVARIDKHIQEDVIAVLRKDHPETLRTDLLRHPRFGSLQDVSGLVSQGQQHGKPLWEIPGANQSLKDVAKTSFFSMADRLLASVGSEVPSNG